MLYLYLLYFFSLFLWKKSNWLLKLYFNFFHLFIAVADTMPHSVFFSQRNCHFFTFFVYFPIPFFLSFFQHLPNLFCRDLCVALSFNFCWSSPPFVEWMTKLPTWQKESCRKKESSFQRMLQHRSLTPWYNNNNMSVYIKRLHQTIIPFVITTGKARKTTKNVTTNLFMTSPNPPDSWQQMLY